MDSTPSHTLAHDDVTRLGDRLRTLPQFLLPTHALSRAVHWATRCRAPWWKERLIDGFMTLYGVNLDDAETGDPRAFDHFNAFFTRALKPGARPLAKTDLVMPVDGRVCYCGPLADGAPVTAKGADFDLVALLGGSRERAAPFAGGVCANLYLAPRNYHRIHLPLAGTLREQVHVPGRLFAVNPAAVRTVPGLFARNERLALLFDTPLGPLALVLVGALFVGSIETVWAGEVTPPRGRQITVRQFHGSDAPSFARGDEIGRFNMGSTVIALFPAGAVELVAGLVPGAAVRLGQALGWKKGLEEGIRD